MIARVRRVPRALRDTGASAVEYGLLVAAIAAVLVGIVFGLGGMMKDTFQDTTNCISNQAKNRPTCQNP